MDRMRDWLDSKDISPGAAIGAIAAVLVVALLGAYMALCIWVQRGDRLLPGTVLADSQGETVADLGKLDRRQAIDTATRVMSEHLEGQGLTLLYGEGKRTELSGSLITSSAEAAVDMGFAAKRSQPNWKLGVLWLGVVSEPTRLPLSSSILTPEGEARAVKIIRSIADEVYVAPVDFTYEISGETATVTPGVDGAEVDTDALLELVKEALAQGQKELQVETRPVSGAELTGKALQKLIRVEAKPAGVDGEGKLVPAVVGLSVDAEKAQAVLDAGREGPWVIPLELTPPAPAEDDSPFYKDLLAQADMDLESADSGAALASKLNGKVLQPGELSSFRETVGEAVTEGEALDRAASALHYCAVYSNLSVAERSCGAVPPSYIEAGLEAAVSGPEQDLKFRNSTGFPIKLVSASEGGKLTVRFYGSNPEGLRVEVQTEAKPTEGWVTVYEPDSSVRRGTTTQRVTPLDGQEVEVYRLVYGAGGKLLSRTLVNTSVYEKRDQVIAYNPADSGPWGAGVANQPAPRPTTRPQTPRPVTPTPTPRPTDPPPEASMPSWLQPTTPSSAPATPAPAPTDPPAQASMPAWLS